MLIFLYDPAMEYLILGTVKSDGSFEIFTI